jgi:hypothetical protein
MMSIECIECGLVFGGEEGYTCPYCDEKKISIQELVGVAECHTHTGYRGWHPQKTKHGHKIIAAWSKKYTDLIGGKTSDAYLIQKMVDGKITSYIDDWGEEFSGSPETNPSFGKWSSEMV